MSHHAKEILESGSDVLKPLLLRHGFAYRALDSGNSSGGQFACAEFRRETRRLEFHFRSSLGMVTYQLKSRSMSHGEYMRSVLVRSNASHYPGFSSNPLDAFRDLRLDLEEYGADFLEGTDEGLLLRIEDALSRLGDQLGLPE